MPQLPRTSTWHLPQPDVETQKYWDAAADGKLMIKHCRRCGRNIFYPRDHCPVCWATDTEWIEASGRGTVYTFTIVRQNDLPPFNERVPYVVAIIELDEGVRMTSNIEGCAPEDVSCGMRVEVSFRPEQRSDEESVSLPVFRPAD
ncbi:MAG: Zn-ribbon domain-containing OB-fold protein [Actinomycetota bacterium]|nr:Zn-ribbon domain-containing OB-fold protein [Actinomycetota bacterium]